MPKIELEKNKSTHLDGAKLFLDIALSLPFLAFSTKQRQAIVQRDGNRCHHPNKAIKCGGSLEVHHIKPQRICLAEGMNPEDIDNPSNAITLCQNHHRGHPDSAHPDAHQALNKYRQGNKKAFEEMFAQRNEIVESGNPYWNTAHDETMSNIAYKRTLIASFKGWIFPWKNGNS